MAYLEGRHELALGLVSQRLSVIDRLRCERVSHGWRRAIRGWGWTEQRTLDHNTLFEGVPMVLVAERRFRFWAWGNGYENLILLLKLTGNALRELDLESFNRRGKEPFVGGGGVVPFYDPPIRELANALQSVPALQTLNIKSFHLAQFVNFLPPTLRYLQTNSLSLQTLETLSQKCPKLEEVPFSKMDYLDVDTLNRFIGKFPCQKKLTARNRSNWATIEAIIGLKKLEALNIGSLDGESFRAICTGCPGLRSLSFDVSDLTEAELFQLATMPALVELKIEGGRRDFTDAVLKAIASRGQLKSFVIDYSSLTNDSVEHLLQTCKSLVHLDVLHSKKITDCSFRAVLDEVHRRYGNPPRVLPRGPLDPGIFYFPFVGEEGYSMDNEMTYKEMAGDYNSINWDWAKAEVEENPWLCVTENRELANRQLY